MENKKVLYAIIIAIVLIGAAFMITGGKEGSVTKKTIQTQETPQKAENTFKNISADELNEMLKKKDFQLINVHTPYIGKIEKTDELIPFNEISANIGKLPSDKNAKIVVYCQSGGMSFIAAKELVSMGYTNVLNLDGGMIDWQNKGYTLIK